MGRRPQWCSHSTVRGSEMWLGEGEAVLVGAIFVVWVLCCMSDDECSKAHGRRGVLRSNVRTSGVLDGRRLGALVMVCVAIGAVFMLRRRFLVQPWARFHGGSQEEPWESLVTFCVAMATGFMVHRCAPSSKEKGGERQARGLRGRPGGKGSGVLAASSRMQAAGEAVLA